MLWYELEMDIRREDCDAVSEILRESGLSGVAFSGTALFYDAKDTRPLDYFDVEGEEFSGNPEDFLVTLKAYITEDQYQEGMIEALKVALSAYYTEVVPNIKASPVDSEEWGTSWKKYYRPEKIGERVVIVPQWEEYEPSSDQVVVRLDPGEAFGTGQHGTTRGAIEAMTHRVKGMRVLDVGCGSGILSIVAAKLGAKSVTGVDIDPLAVKVASENVEINEVSDTVDIKVGDLVSQTEGSFDVVVANIFKDVIIRLLPDLEKVSEKLVFISSGFVTKFEEEVTKELLSYGHRIIDRYVIEDWVTLVSEVRGRA